MINFCKKLILLFALAAFVLPSCTKKPGATPPTTVGTALTVKDTDGNVYHIITIGTQQWLAENLKTTHYRDGAPIPNITDSQGWVTNFNGAYCNYNNTPSNADIYGRLYNWYAATNAHNICPKGWHVPSDSEWTTLSLYLGLASGGLKDTGTTYWQSPNIGATNVTGFSALPGGYRGLDEMFTDLGYSAVWWCSTEFDATNAWYRSMASSLTNVNRTTGIRKTDGFSVRCIKD